MTCEAWSKKFQTKGFSVKMFNGKFAIYRHNFLITVCRDEIELETIFIVLKAHKIKTEYLYEYEGEKYSVKEIAEKVGVAEYVIYNRLSKCTKMEDVFRPKGARKGRKNVREELRQLSKKCNLPLSTLWNRWYLGERGEELTRPKRTKFDLKKAMYEALHNL